jgi:hypothetical protein
MRLGRSIRVTGLQAFGREEHWQASGTPEIGRERSVGKGAGGAGGTSARAEPGVWPRMALVAVDDTPCLADDAGTH